MKKIIRMLAAVSGILILVAVSNHFRTKSQTTLADYADANPEIAYMTHEKAEAENDEEDIVDDRDQQSAESNENEQETEVLSNPNTAEETAKETTGEVTGIEEVAEKQLPTSATFTSSEEASEYFYFEELSEDLQRYMTGISYPLDDTDLQIHFEDLRHVVVLHYDFNGEVAKGELVCNEAIAQDLVDIFFELFRNEYRIERICLVDEYKGDDVASMEANNTSCFNYRVIAGTSKLSTHALGLAVDINPLYNPYITYSDDGSANISPESAAPYADRSGSFAYKIDDDDLAFKLFTEHGFTWGGYWNSSKDYQHFQKAID